MIKQLNETNTISTYEFTKCWFIKRYQHILRRPYKACCDKKAVLNYLKIPIDLHVAFAVIIIVSQATFGIIFWDVTESFGEHMERRMVGNVLCTIRLCFGVSRRAWNVRQYSKNDIVAIILMQCHFNDALEFFRTITARESLWTH